MDQNQTASPEGMEGGGLEEVGGAVRHGRFDGCWSFHLVKMSRRLNVSSEGLGTDI